MSRFVSGGSNDEPTERDEAWLKAQQEIEAKHRAQPKPGEQDGGKSLFETLQANKAAKQEAFEEATRLRNQFRSLDEDEIDFLDSVLESTRSKEAEVRKETVEQLEAFRKRQEEAEKAAALGDESVEAPIAGEVWAVAPKKRKKGREKEVLGGVKLRRTSTAEKKDVQPTASEPSTKAPHSPAVEDRAPAKKLVEAASGRSTTTTTEEIKAQNVPATTSPPASATALGLAAYSSDED